MKCDICGEEMIPSEEEETLVGYSSPKGHNHDDNCRSKRYKCCNGHLKIYFRRNRCNYPGCNWIGKETCRCHKGKKVEEYPI